MIGSLDQNKIDYILFHLTQHVDLHDDWLSKFHFISNKAGIKNLERKIVFPLSAEELKPEKALWVDGIPILFPLSDKQQIFYFDQNNNLCFHHDLLKSIFYLLSGYQETLHHKPDYYGRYPYSDSIQCKLNFIHKPIVNYYFKWIIDGLKEFATQNKLQLKIKSTSGKFILTHDIDSIDKYDIYNLLYSVKELLGLTKTNVNLKTRFGNFIDYLINYIKIINRPNPYWNFDSLIKTAPKITSRHIFFFLEKDQLHKDSYYKFNNKRIKKLFNKLTENNCEIGIHGTVASSESTSVMKSTIQNLEKESGLKVMANRQHCLKYKRNITPLIHEEAGLSEDFTLGFAAHEGFRNSYCHPFKLFDFDKNQMVNVWQFPLNVMDNTLLEYRGLSFDEAKNSINSLIDEVNSFNGVFTLLWHNSYFNEKQFPGITMFYKEILNIFENKIRN